jgi:hypothetical protein
MCDFTGCWRDIWCVHQYEVEQAAIDLGWSQTVSGRAHYCHEHSSDIGRNRSVAQWQDSLALAGKWPGPEVAGAQESGPSERR